MIIMTKEKILSIILCFITYQWNVRTFLPHRTKIEINFTNNAKRSIKMQSLVDEGLKGEGSWVKGLRDIRFQLSVCKAPTKDLIDFRDL